MKCPITKIESVHKESSPNYANLLINNVFYALSLPRSIADYIVQAINGHEKLVRVIEETNQCFKCKFGYRQQALNCPGEADAELPCAGFIEEHKGLNYLERALKEAEKP